MHDTAPFDDLQIVEAGPARIAELADLFDEYRVFYGQPRDRIGAEAFIGERVARGESVIFLARASVDGETVPLGFTQLYPSFSSVSMKRLWILNDLFVRPVARRSGVARALLDRATQLARDTGARGVILETTMDNHEAQALYDSYGYKKDTEFFRYTLDI